MCIYAIISGVISHEVLKSKDDDSLPGRDKLEGVGTVAENNAQNLHGDARQHGEEGRQDLRD